MVTIIADSTCDLPEPMYAEYDIRTIPLKVSIADATYLDKAEVDTQMLFRMVQQYKQMPITAAPSPNQYKEAFEQGLRDGDSVICFTCSSALSGSYQSACVASEMVDGKVDVIDTRTAAEGSGLTLLDGARMARAGVPHETIVQHCRRRVASMRTLIVLDTVEFLRRGGRISAVSARMASMLSIKPIINVLKDGSNAVIHKARSYSKGMEWVLNYVLETGRDLKNQTIGVGYSSVQEPALKFIELLKRHVQPKEIILAGIGSVVGTHIGPNAFGVFWEEK